MRIVLILAIQSRFVCQILVPAMLTEALLSQINILLTFTIYNFDVGMDASGPVSW